MSYGDLGYSSGKAYEKTKRRLDTQEQLPHNKLKQRCVLMRDQVIEQVSTCAYGSFVQVSAGASASSGSAVTPGPTSSPKSVGPPVQSVATQNVVKEEFQESVAQQTQYGVTEGIQEFQESVTQQTQYVVKEQIHESDNDNHEDFVAIEGPYMTM